MHPIHQWLDENFNREAVEFPDSAVVVSYVPKSWDIPPCPRLHDRETFPIHKGRQRFRNITEWKL